MLPYGSMQAYMIFIIPVALHQKARRIFALIQSRPWR